MEDRTEEIARALCDTAKELDWHPTRIAACVNKGERAARMWMDGDAAISGPDLLALLRTMPGLAERLLPGPTQAAA